MQTHSAELNVPIVIGLLCAAVTAGLVALFLPQLATRMSKPAPAIVLRSDTQFKDELSRIPRLPKAQPPTAELLNPSWVSSPIAPGQ
jgi:hypothetical protein